MSLSSSDSESQVKTVDAVSVKLPPFYTKDPQGWFLHAIAQFGICDISVDETCYLHLMASLDTETMSHASRAVKVATLVYAMLHCRNSFSSASQFLLKNLKCFSIPSQVLLTQLLAAPPEDPHYAGAQ